MNLRDLKTIKERRDVIEIASDTKLPQIGSHIANLEVASTKNCENMIGAAQIPLGIAGPLAIQHVIQSESDGSDKKDFSVTHQNQNTLREYYIPLATTEGALVASISRGCKIITKSGGAIVDSHNVGVTRGPVFYTGTIKNGTKLWKWIKENKSELAKVCEITSGHLTLKDIVVKSLANYTFVRFVYDTQDAMGMNMATIATQRAVEYIEQETGINCVAVGGNFDIDKKPAWLNSILGRGMKVWAEVIIARGDVETILKTTPEKFFDTWLSKVMLGSAVSGSIGFNAHISNVIAALFIATGQDPAHVVEGSLGITTAKVLENGDLYVGVFLPSLLVGTVGGGTSLPTQSEALEILGVKGEGKVGEFAEVIGAACLAGEISLLASLTEGTLAKSHLRLGRAK